MNTMNKKNNKKAWLLGLGFDSKDGHLRITHGKNYHLYGGSENTHNVMFEKVTKFNEQLDKKGKKLDNMSAHEFYDLASKAGLKVTDPNRN